MRIDDPKAIDERALNTLGVRGIAHLTPGSIQVLVAGAPEDWAAPLRGLLASRVTEGS